MPFFKLRIHSVDYFDPHGMGIGYSTTERIVRHPNELHAMDIAHASLERCGRRVTGIETLAMWPDIAGTKARAVDACSDLECHGECREPHHTEEQSE